MLLALLAPVDASPPTGVASYESLTVAQCAELAARNAPEVLSPRAEARAAAYDSGAVAANRRPGLALAVGGLVAPQGFYDPVVTNLGEYHAKVVLDWPLADGGARRRLRHTAALTAEGSRLDAATAAREASLRAIAVALDLVRTDELRLVHTDAESWLDDLNLLVESGALLARMEASPDMRRVPTSPGHWARLGDLAPLVVSPGETESSRDDQRTMVSATARLSDRDLGSAMKEIQRRMGRQVAIALASLAGVFVALHAMGSTFSIASFVAALAPLAIGQGSGAALLQPLAIAVIGGFAGSAPLLLLVLPHWLAATGQAD